ncbi:MAG: hypothetical protein IT423_19485 [Pirellulaceae bacterium]|nr:hypothetical protein [Pirellulaceae bacterium]
MAVESLSERPIFASEENQYLTPARPPLSRLAICSLLAGVGSSLVLFSLDLIALPILAVALSLVAFLVLRNNDAASGQWMTLAGLFMALAFGLWSYTSSRMRDQYLYDVASQMAIHFVGMISEKKLLEAHELTKPETQRQVAGTSLEDFYRLTDELTKQTLDAFKTETAVKQIVALGDEAKWVYNGGVRVMKTQGNTMHVMVSLINAAPNGGDKVNVTISREYHAGSATWHVISVR